ncbi:MAG: ATP-binding protein, partial [Candidatus Berkiellales bacterium]
MLENLLSQNEGKTLEFKENTASLEPIIKTIIAFTNTAGGTLVIGIRDKTKEIIGVGDVLKEEERIANAVSDSISPQIIPNFQFFTWRKVDLLIVSVSHNIGPHFLKSKGIEQGVYIRLGSTNRIADKTTVSEIQRLATHHSFDEMPNLNAKNEDIDFNLAEELFNKHSRKFDKNVAKSIQLLVKFQFDYYPSNGAILLFGKNRRLLFSNAIVQCGLFSGQSKSNILDQQEIDAPLPIALNQILTFIQRNTQTRSEIGSKERVDIPQYPPVVIREAVINALVHADYAIKGANVQIAIYSDRIEITNPGALPFGLSLEKALSGMSQLRNKVIGHVFRELGLIERWGSGFRRMIETCQSVGIRTPIFEECDRFFKVTIFHEPYSMILEEEWQKKMVEYLHQNHKITIKEAGILWEVANRTAATRL